MSIEIVELSHTVIIEKAVFGCKNEVEGYALIQNAFFVLLFGPILKLVLHFLVNY
jgi:uncharacterized membrane protein